jgi:uncharacterized membrane protein YkoI
MRKIFSPLRLLMATALVAGAGVLHAFGGDHGHAREDSGRPHGGHEDHDVAREAMKRGEIMPLERVVAEVRKTISGNIVGVELENKHGTWVYEFKVLAPDGSMIDVYADARTAAILKVKGK